MVFKSRTLNVPVCPQHLGPAQFAAGGLRMGLIGEQNCSRIGTKLTCWLSPCDCTAMWIVLLGVQLIPKCDNVCPSAKESEDKENLPKRTSAGGFKFTFSHSASPANGANGANSKSVAAQTSPASSNGSSSKNMALSPAVPAPKVGELVWGCPRVTAATACGGSRAELGTNSP